MSSNTFWKCTNCDLHNPLQTFTCKACFKHKQKDENKSFQECKVMDKDKIMIILTGATGVIGGVIATELISKPNISLHLLIRNKQKVQSLINQKLNKYIHKSSSVQYHFVDLSSKQSINSFLKTFISQYSYLDILINGAAIVPKSYHFTNDNEELQFSVNVMSYIRLMIGLLPLLIHSGNDKKRRYNDIKQLSQYGECAKIVNVASQYTTTLSNIPSQTFNLSPNQKHKYNPNQQYKKTKSANRMLSFKASELWNKKGYNIGVYSCHPGVTNSNVLRGLGFGGGWDSPQQSAKTPLFCAINNKIGLEQSGKFFVNSKPNHCQYCRNHKKVQIIWDYCYSLLKFSK